jgi:transposase-like protein
VEPLSLADFYPDQYKPQKPAEPPKTLQKVTKFNAHELSDIEKIKLYLERGLTYEQIAEKLGCHRVVVSKKIEKWMRTVDFDDWLNCWWLRLGLELSADPQTRPGVFRQLTRLKGLKETRQTKIELKAESTEKVDVNLRYSSVKVELARYEQLIRETEFQT